MTDPPMAASFGAFSSINWEELHRRLAGAREALEHESRPTLEERERILAARAQALAEEPSAPETGEDRLRVLEFLLAQETYALETAFIREVCPLKEFTPVPCTPAFVLGLVNVRGQILSVINLNTRGKLVCGLGLVVVLLLAVILIAYSGISAIRESQRVLYDVNYANVIDLLHLDADSNDNRAATLTLTLLNDPSARETWRQSLEETAKENDARIARLFERTRADPGVSGMFADYRDLRSAFTNTRDSEVLPLIEVGDAMKSVS